MGVAENGILDIALDIRPHFVCLVPERREEVTTEGGLNLDHNTPALSSAIERLHENGSVVSLFIEPSEALFAKPKH